MTDHYVLAIYFESEDRPPTWDIIKGTPNVRDLLDCCVNQANATVESFVMVRNGELISDEDLKKHVEIDRWPPAFSH